jgi:hypothetical protein
LFALIQTRHTAGPRQIGSARNFSIRSARNFSNPALVLAACPKQLAAWGTIQLLGELYLPAFGAAMLTSKEYLQRAEECSQLANASSDAYVKEALAELASDFRAMAKDLEQRNER